MLFTKSQNGSRGVRCLLAYFCNASQEESNSLSPFAIVAHGLQFLVILWTAALEKVREIKNRLKQYFLFAEQKSNKKSPHAPVAVQKRMNRLELGMRHSNPDERGAVSGIMEKRLQLPQSDGCFIGRRRNKFGLVQSATFRSDSVLPSPQFARSQVRSTRTLQKFGVDFSNQPRGNWKLAQAFQAVIHRFNAIQRFIGISCG